MPRRIPDFPDAYTEWNAISSFGSIISLLASLIFFYAIYRTFADLNDQDVVKDQLEATRHFFDNLEDSKMGGGYTSLEWTLDNPPVLHTFEQQPYIA
jgi:cytochrome c oxidase subunit 1